MGCLKASSHRAVHFEKPLGCGTHWTVQEVVLALLLKMLWTELYGTAVPRNLIPQTHCNCTEITKAVHLNMVQKKVHAMHNSYTAFWYELALTLCTSI